MNGDDSTVAGSSDVVVLLDGGSASRAAVDDLSLPIMFSMVNGCLTVSDVFVVVIVDVFTGDAVVSLARGGSCVAPVSATNSPPYNRRSLAWYCKHAAALESAVLNSSPAGPPTAAGAPRLGADADSLRACRQRWTLNRFRRRRKLPLSNMSPQAGCSAQ